MTRRNPFVRFAPSYVGRRRVRHDHVEVADEGGEIRPQHADDLKRLAIQHQRLTDRISGPAESTLPQAVADDRRWTLLVRQVQGSSELDLRAGHLEIVG
jgi:hypothetical protein